MSNPAAINERKVASVDIQYFLFGDIKNDFKDIAVPLELYSFKPLEDSLRECAQWYLFVKICIYCPRLCSIWQDYLDYVKCYT